MARDGKTVPLEIRTSRMLHRRDERWAQVHHHGSITDAEALATYRRAVKG